jgi:hypothetical protein
MSGSRLLGRLEPPDDDYVEDSGKALLTMACQDRNCATALHNFSSVGNRSANCAERRRASSYVARRSRWFGSAA